MKDSAPIRRRIWLVTIGEPLPIEGDSRALRCRMLARELARRGHEVTWWTSDFDHFAKRHHPPGNDEQAFEGYRLRFLRGRAYRRNISLARQINHHQLARDFAAKAGQAAPPDAIVCSFPPIELTDAVIGFARKRGVPSIFDVRDLWPDEAVARVPRWARGAAELVVSPLRRRVSAAARNATAVVGVSRLYRDWGLKHAGRPEREADQIIPLGYPDSDQSRAIRRSRSNETSGPCRFLFSGSFNLSVDVGLIIAAFRRLAHLDMTAIVCGTGEKEAEWIAQAAGDPRIKFAGWVNGEEIRRHAGECDAGLVCYRPNSLVSLPNKLFEYLSFGLPVVNSLEGEAADRVRDHGVGWNYRAGSLDSLCDVLEACAAAHGEGTLPFGAAASLYENDYASDRVYARFANLVESLAG
jgi:glycosyltransferase involved in cell wall biosynthesis